MNYMRYAKRIKRRTAYDRGWRDGHADRLLGRRLQTAMDAPNRSYRSGYRAAQLTVEELLLLAAMREEGYNP